MKKIILLNAILLAFPLAINAKIITPASTLKINSPDGLTSIKDLSVSLNINCRYKAGIFFPESKSCGNQTIKLSIDEAGVVNIPKTETFSGLHATKINNYELSLTVNEGEQYLAVLSARGRDAINVFASNKKDLNILRFKEAHLAVAKDGADFFNSELAKKTNAYLLFSISSSITPSTLDGIFVVSSLNNFLKSLENRNPYQGKLLLKDAREIFVPETSLAYLGEEKNIELRVYLSVAEINNGTHELETKAQLSTPATNSALSDIGTIELK